MLVFWPSSLSFSVDGKSISALIFIVLSFILLLCSRYCTIKKNVQNILFIIFVLYLLINNLINGFLYQSFSNFNELIRICGVIAAFYLGAKVNLYDIDRKAFIFCFIFMFICLSISLLLGYPFDAFYFPKDVRLSWFSVGVNYLFGYIILSCLIIHCTFQKSKLDILGILAFFCIILFQLLSSGSRTSFLVCSIFIFLYFTFHKPKHMVFLIIFILVFILSKFSFVKEIDHVYRLVEFSKLIVSLDYEDFSNIHSFDKRSANLIEVKNLISNNLIFGHGAGKNIIKVIDSNFYMTIFRYGYFGFFIESIFIVSVFVRVLMKNEIPNIFAISILCFVLSFVTLATLYELRCTYIFFFICGFICNYNFKNISLK